MANAPILEFEQISKRFGATRAVDGVSVEVRPGEFFALLGPSGCGKTTLMRMAAGFDRPDEGRVRIDGADMAHMPPHRRPVNMMFQSYALFPHMSVADNIAFGLSSLGLARDALSARVAEMVGLVQLQGLEKRRPHQLSGGQKQRAALARALARGPKLLLLDEPLGALDRKLREETQFALIDIQKRLGTAFVVVTHDQDEAMSMADRIAVMRAGRIEQVGAPAEIYERPRTRFVADFVGEINIFEGRVVACADGVARVETKDGALVAPCDRETAVGGELAVAVRPERLAFAADDGALPPSPPPGGRGNRLAGVVQDVVYRGDHSIYRVRLPSGARVRVSQSSTLPGLAIGAATAIDFDPANCIVLTS